MKKCTLFFILVGITAFSMAQDPLFTQKTGNINHFNPALVGAQSDFGVQANYNNQWPTLPLNPITSSLLTNYNLKNGLGFGLEVKSESVGSTRSDALKANINHAFSKNGFELRSGLNIGVLQNSIDVTKLNFRDPNDPILNEIKKHNPKRGVSLDIGAAAYYKGFLLGLAIQQLNEPDITFFNSTCNQPMRFGGNLAYIKEFNQFNLAGLATFQQDGNYSMIETQVFGQYKFVKLGLGYHQRFGSFGDSDIFSAAFGIQFDKFSVGYSYDDDFSNISRASSAGTHQATAAWYIKRLNKERGMSRLMNVLL
ncbi:MAG: type IX secretion system PorP/SprF family membrane protein [Lentimonas sp.]|jgi:type IX secretion system PorP/SprF family membrane protein